MPPAPPFAAQQTAPHTLRLLRRGILIFYFLVVVLTIVVIAWSTWVDYQQSLQSFERQSLSLARSLDEHATRTFASVEQAMQNVIESIEKQGGVTQVSEMTLHRVLKEKTQLTPHIRGIIAIDQFGILKAHGLEFPARRVDLSDRSYFPFHRDKAGNQPLIDTPVISRTDGQWLIPVTMRVNTPQGDFGGILLSGVEPSYFLHFYDSLRLEEGIQIDLLRADGTVLLTYPFDKNRMGQNLRSPHPNEFDNFANQIRTVYEDSGSKDKAFVTFHVNQSSLPLIIRLTSSRRVVFHSFIDNTITRVGTGIGILCVVSVMLYLLLRQIRRVADVESKLHLTQSSVDESPDMLFWCQPDGQLCYANHSLIRLAELDPARLDEINISHVFQLAPQEWLTACHTLRYGARQTLETCYISAATESIPVEMTLSRIGFNNKDYICVTARDIRERKAVETELRQHRDHLQEMVDERSNEIRTVLDASPLAIMLSVEGSIHLANPAFETLFGYKTTEVLHQPEYVIYGSAGRYAELQPFIRSQIVTHDSTYRGEIELQRRDQSKFWAMLFVKALSADEPERGIISIIEDISASRLAAQALRQSERMKRSIIDATSDSFLLVDPRRQIIDTNPAFCELIAMPHHQILGHKPEDLLGQQAFMLFPQLTPDTELAQARVGEVLLPVADGRQHTFLANTGVVTDEQNKTEHLFAFLTDITPLKEIERTLAKAKEAAEAANIAKSAFLASMSHELRTPMHAILSFSELGVEKITQVDLDNLKRYFERIHTSGSRLLALVNDLLDISKLEANSMQYDMVQHRLQSSLHAAITEIAPLLTEKELHIVMNNEEAPVLATFDHERIMQVILNLLSNAIKFSPPLGKIEITLLPEAQLSDGRPAVGVSIRDQGPGVSDEDHLSIFEKFVQGKKSSNMQGTGLGLAICQQIIQDHRGEIQVHNHENGGAVFTFFLPIELNSSTESGSNAGI